MEEAEDPRYDSILKDYKKDISYDLFPSFFRLKCLHPGNIMLWRYNFRGEASGWCKAEYECLPRDSLEYKSKIPAQEIDIKEIVFSYRGSTADGDEEGKWITVRPTRRMG